MRKVAEDFWLSPTLFKTVRDSVRTVFSFKKIHINTTLIQIASKKYT